MSELFNKVQKFIKEYFKEHGFERQIKHLERTVYWVKKLKPNADEAFLIAALSHDIQTASRWKELQKEISKTRFIDKERLEEHQREGARIIGKFLEKQGASSELINRVKLLVSKHEEGGTRDQNLLKDADSISFFENNIQTFLERVKDVGKEKIREKFDWMYNRITSEEVRDIVRPWYQKAINDLEKISK